MNKVIKTIGLLILILISQIASGQKQKKIYYDKGWMVTQSEAKAKYYRLITFAEDGKPMGIVKGYYITGEIQWEGKILYFDKHDNRNDLSDGRCIWYYKNGKKSRESLFVDGKEEGLTINWYEGGEILREIEYKSGIFNGKYIIYYENGKIKFRAEYKDGKLVDKWTVECDEFENCQKVFLDGFSNLENTNNWNLYKQENFVSKVIEKKGLRMETKSDLGFGQLIHIPLDLEENFSIETIVNHESGDKNSGEGLIFGFMDWDNYFYFTLSASGYFTIGAKSEGINLEFVKWQKTEYINQITNRNLLKINRLEDKIYYSINGQIVGIENYYSFKGNFMGFQIVSGKKRVLFERLLIRQDIKGSDMISEFPSSEWKGNGTGFIIDTKGYIVTNFHVIEGAAEIGIDLIQNGIKNSFNAKVISSDKNNDLTILRIDDPKFQPPSKLPYNFKLQISDVGTNVFTLGYPLSNIMGDEIKFTDGKISSKTGFKGDITTYQISVPVQP